MKFLETRWIGFSVMVRGGGGEKRTSDLVTHVVRGMAWEVNRAGGQRADVELLIILQQTIEDVGIFLVGDVVPLSEQVLRFLDAAANADVRLLVLGFCQLGLDIRCGSDVVGVNMRLQDQFDMVSPLLDQIQDCICRCGGDGALGSLVVQDGVDDDGL